jgi:hypothetical protein
VPMLPLSIRIFTFGSLEDIYTSAHHYSLGVRERRGRIWRMQELF